MLVCAHNGAVGHFQLTWSSLMLAASKALLIMR
jgi:hypothetical protein